MLLVLASLGPAVLCSSGYKTCNQVNSVLWIGAQAKLARINAKWRPPLNGWSLEIQCEGSHPGPYLLHLGITAPSSWHGTWRLRETPIDHTGYICCSTRLRSLEECAGSLGKEGYWIEWFTQAGWGYISFCSSAGERGGGSPFSFSLAPCLCIFSEHFLCASTGGAAVNKVDPLFALKASVVGEKL